MLIEGVLFDLYGTLIPCPDRDAHRKMLNGMSSTLGVDRDMFERQWRDSYKERTGGVGKDGPGYLRYLTERMGLKLEQELLEEASVFWADLNREVMKFFTDVEPTLSELNQRGLRVGLMSNCTCHLPPQLEKSSLRKYFKSVSFSTELGLVKPEPEFFREAVRMLGTRTDRTMFVGDGDNSELSAARGAGLVPVKIARPEVVDSYSHAGREPWEPSIEGLNELFELIDVI